MIDLDELRHRIAVKHGVLLGTDDPILVTVTLNEMVLRAYLDQANAAQNEAQRALTVSLQQQVEQSKETAGKLVTAAAEYVGREVRQAVTSALTDATEQIRHRLNDAAHADRDAQAAKQGAMIAAMIAVAATLVALACAVVVLVK